MSNLLLDKEILLESGTNELEVLVFDVADYTFGINVAKVREVLPSNEITALPQAHPSVRGVFKLRDQVIPCVSLMDHLGIESTRENSETTLILTDLNKQQTAFLVDAVERIHRLSWENILAVPSLDALAQTPVTALARCDSRLVVMLDFEMVLDEVTDRYFRVDKVENPQGIAREKMRILLAEDSPTVRQAIGETLHNSGYDKVTFFENGAEAWAWIDKRFQATGRVEDIGDLLVCDIEMPQVDGLHLTKRIKEHPELKSLPVLLYSSIITPDNRKKGMAVGADAQVAKPELNRVVELADELIVKSQRKARSESLKEITQAAQEEEARSIESTPPTPDKTPVVETPVAETPVVETPVAETPVVETPVALQPTPSPSKGVVIESNPERPLEATFAAVPENVNSKLWNTFCDELTGRVASLRDHLRHIERRGRDERVLQEMARTLHTIKSAAMVVPIDRVTQCTHLIESLLELARADSQEWPSEGFQEYLYWLNALVSHPADVNAALSAGRAVEQELIRVLAAEA